MNSLHKDKRMRDGLTGLSQPAGRLEPHSMWPLVLCLLLLLLPGVVRAQSAVDGFDPGANGDVIAIAIQADGKILVGGAFTTLGGGGTGTTTRNRLGRLNVDGTVDTNFNPGANNNVTALAVQADGKILVGGDFTTLGGGGTGITARNHLGRLNADGSVDPSFDPGANDSVVALVIQLDGKILVGGFFNTLGGGGIGTTSRKFIGRLNVDGTIDTDFDPGADSDVLALALQADGKILLGGNFTTLGGGDTGTIARNKIGRLNADGTLDTSFDPGANAFVLALLVQADGKILVGGGFTTFGGGGTGTPGHNFIGRLNPDGTLDSGFDPGANGPVIALVVQADGKILLGGDFTTLGGGGTGTTPRNFLGRLNADGVLDAGFDPGTNNFILALAVQADGKMLVGGASTTLGGGGNGTTTRNFIGRLNADGTLDSNFNPEANGAVLALAVQADGKILVGGAFTTLGGGSGATPRNFIGRLNADGTLDAGFDPGTDQEVDALVVQGDGKILVGGSFTTLGGGSTGTTTRHNLGRLNADGTLDASFNPGTNGQVIAIAVQTDGKILVGGFFTTLGGGGVGTTPRRFIGRLNADGTLDTSFDPGANGAVFALAVQADGKILVGGNFTTLGGGGSGITLRNYLGRLDADGTIDIGFDPGANGGVEDLAVQDDGKILVAGNITALGGGGAGTTTRNGFGRLNADGILDADFDPAPNGKVASIALQADGKILVGGGFSTLGGGDSGPTTRQRIGRLNADGTVDQSFDAGANSNVSALAVQTDGKVLAGGYFTTLDGGGSGISTRNFIARLTNTAAALQSLSSSFNGTTIQWLRSQASPEVARVSFELSTDGLTYSPLGNGSRVPGGWQLTGLTLANHQNLYIRARGFYATGISNASGSIAESVSLINNQISPQAGAPSVNSISPSSAIAGAAGFTLTVDGAGFVDGCVIRVNGLDKTTTFVNSTQLTTAIDATEIATAGTLSVTVTNQTLGNTSSPLILTVANSVPTISSISPASFVAPPFCGSALTLTVNGTNFVSNSIIRLNAISHTTDFVSSTRLTAQITEADIQTATLFPLGITVENPTPGGGTSNSVFLFMNEPWSTITSLSPASATAGNGSFTLVVNGSNFGCNSVVLFNSSNRPTIFVSETQLTAQLTTADVQAPGTFPIHVFRPAPGSGVSNAVNFTVVPPLVDVSGISPTSTAAGGPGFTLTVNGNNFFDGFIVRWNGTDRPTTVVNANQLTASITAADIETAGTAAVTIFVPGGAISPPFPFMITCACGYEGDVAPRPTGSNTGAISIADWVQQGRFSAGLDTPAEGCEFQRADSAPRSTLGNGSITLSDWVQAGRYASGLDAPQCAGGPSGPLTGPESAVSQIETEPAKTQRANGKESAIAEPTTVNLVSTILPAGQSSTVSIEFDAQGNENALGFSLMFDPAKLSFVSAEKSIEASAATLIVNKLHAARGQVGIALALPTGSTFVSGRHPLVVLTFNRRADSSEPRLGFTDQPVAREVVDLNANRLEAVFQASSGNPLEDAQFFVNQHYLDFLNRTPDSEGLEYWTQQVNECGTDKLCISQRRRAVSAAFFMELEFQETGSFVYRLYKAGLGRQLSYPEFAADRGQVIGGANLNTSKTAFADAFVERAEFVQKYRQHPTAEAFVDVVLNQVWESSQVDLAPGRSGLIALYQTGSNTNQSRSRVLQMVIEDSSYKQAEYNPSFVLMEYFGYLRRDPDKGGYDFWLNVLNNREPGNYRGMVCSFITSTEYQRRFSKVVSRSTADCQ